MDLRRFALIAFSLATLLVGLAACGDGNAAEIAALKQQVQDLQEQIAASTTSPTTTIPLTTTTLPSTTTMATATTAMATTTTAPPPRTLTGELVLLGLSSRYIGQDVAILVDDTLSHCLGHKGFDDLGSSTQVRVRDEFGATVGIATVGSPWYEEVEPMKGAIGIGYCHFPFTLEVPSDRQFYSVEVADRGEVVFTFGELETRGWQVELSLGG